MVEIGCRCRRPLYSLDRHVWRNPKVIQMIQISRSINVAFSWADCNCLPNHFFTSSTLRDQLLVLELSTRSYTSVVGCPAEFGIINDYADSWYGSSDINPGTRRANIVQKAPAAEVLLNSVQTKYDFYGCLAAHHQMCKAPELHEADACDRI